MVTYDRHTTLVHTDIQSEWINLYEWMNLHCALEADIFGLNLSRLVINYKIN